MIHTGMPFAAVLDETKHSAADRLDAVVTMMREMSRQSDPQAMVRAYGARMRELIPSDGFIGLSRRDLQEPFYRITRFSGWETEINPWTERDRLPLLQGGLLGGLIHGDAPRILNDLEIDPEDPAAFYLEGTRSIMAIPNYDKGAGLNMTVRLSRQPDTFDPENFPEHVWMSNLFGRATQNLVLSEELKKAYEVVERELRVVADIQRSLLPKTMPEIPNLGLAAHYQTSKWAGGDYYDFFPYADGRWGVMIADVSGHGTPAAVMMAITHSIAHAFPGHPDPPGRMLEYLNDRLCAAYTADNEAFVTAFFGVFDPRTREFRYACAGHNPPRWKRCQDGTISSLDSVSGLPLGLFPDQRYEENVESLIPGDQIIFYTDGITEATNPAGTMFGLDRLDVVLENCHLTAEGLIDEVLDALNAFTLDAPPADDQTILVAKVS
jgi:sigma-B regulation protein RsbU (phosphoserine phosphatase)